MSDDDIEPRHKATHADWPAWIVVGLIAAITFVVYLPCLHGDFLDWDDDKNFDPALNPNFGSLSPRFVLWAFTTTHMGPYQPLSWLTLGLDHTLWGRNPFGYHLTNVLLHAAAAGMLGLLMWTLLAAGCHPHERAVVGRSDPPDGHAIPSGRALVLLVPAAGAALAWALHPQRVESVAWITERRDVLSGLLIFACVWAYLRARLAERHDAPSHGWDQAAQISFVLALLSKAMAVSVPFVLLVLDVVPLRRLDPRPWRWLNEPNRPVLAEKFNYVLFAALAVAVGFVGQSKAGALRGIEQVGLLERIAIVAHAIWFYLSNTAWPADLAPLYPRPQAIALTDPRFLYPLLLAMGITAVAILAARRIPALSAAWVGYLLMLAPVSGLVTIGDELVADRYSYLPTVALFALAAGGLAWLWSRCRGTAAVLVARAGSGVALLGVLAALGWQARQVMPIWRDSLSLWTAATERRPGSHKAWNNLGAVLNKPEHRLPEQAEKACLRAIKIRPEYASAYYNLGISFMRQGRFDAAAGAYRKALEIEPDNALALANLGTVLVWLDRPEEGLARLERAVELDRHQFRNATFQIGEALRKLGRYEEAAERYEQAMKVTPHHLGPRAGLADVYLHLDRVADAERMALAVYQGNRKRPEGPYALAQVRARQERYDQAVALLRQVLAKNKAFRDRAMVDPHFERLRDRREFRRLMRSLPPITTKKTSARAMGR